jgi:hybrid polyketide synthase/nonribosomal peptide synthetase ACE1
MSSYTYTDISVGFFDKAAVLFKAYSDKMAFKVLDIEKPPSTQGYEPYSYDIVIASNVLHATSVLQRALENTRQLLKPGGYLMLLEVTSDGPIRCGTIMGGLPGWWVGGSDGRKYAPTITPEQWHSALRKVGFAGIDAITPEIDVLPWPFSIMAAQAVDDRVQFLRRPLLKSTSSIYLESVVILGTGSLESARIAEELAEFLGTFCRQMTILNGLPTNAEALEINPMSTFINLVDIDSPIFKNMTAERMDGLRRLLELASHILWITLGAQADEPYHMASIAFSRAISHEAQHISLNHLDVSDLDHNASRVIAEHLLRQCALEEWEALTSKQQHQQFLWSKESEVFLDRGQLLIPRLVANVGQNARLNSSRRTITKSVPISSSSISISLSPDSRSSLVEEVLPVALKYNQSLVRVENSSLTALHVAADTFLFVGIGKDAKNEAVIVLSTTNSSETTPIASVATGADHITQSADGLLIAVASELLAASLIRDLSSGSSIMVHCSGEDRFLAAALSRRAAAKAVRVMFTCEAESTDDAQDPTWIKLNARAPRYAVQRLLLAAKHTHFLDSTAYSCPDPSELSLKIAQALPSGCKRIDLSDLSRHQSLLPDPSSSQEILVDRLKDALSSARKVAASIAQEQVQDLVVQLDQIHDLAVPNHVTSVVHWPLDGDIKVEVRPLDARRFFSQDKTYLLVGLTGQIGQSLCEWMISNGAGCVCLTSRHPKISKKWLESFQGTNAMVKIFAMDVTDKYSLEKVVIDIRASCPPIAGVANGAMVLHDSLFSGMSLGTMQDVLGPKIDGTNNLDQIFHDDDLDFFILFSSSACVVGNSGQANYAAANGYINSLARQRRKRGLAASAIDIGRVAGIGYVETVGQAVVDQLTRFGLMAISESEFHQMFAETIRAGYTNLKNNEAIPDAVVTTGIRTIHDEEIKGPWAENSRFSHYIVEAKSVESGGDQQNKKMTLHVSEQLASAATTEQALEVLQECFAAKLRIILQISNQEIDNDAPLIELGVDSLVAVEVRSWFLKELKVDIPVLKLVGGASIAELCEQALKKLPDELFSTIGSQETRKPAVTQSPPPEPRVIDSSSSSEDNSTAASLQFPKNGLTGGIPSTQLSSRSTSSENLADSFKMSTNTPPLPAGERLLRRFLKSVPISFGQSRFWFLRLLLEDQTTFNVAFYYQVTGNLHVDQLERAIRIVTARHEALRTSFVADETKADQAYQKVAGSSPLRLERKKIESVEDVAAEYAKLKAHVFDLANGEMIRLVLLTLLSSTHYLLINHHHIVMDGVSFQVFLSDLEKAYNNQSLGATPRQFPDFSAAQRQAFEKGEMNDELKYWRGVFPAGEQPPILPLLPMARTSSRISMKNFDIHQVGCRLEPELATRVKLMSRAQRSTPFHFYLATFKAMLFCFTDAQDLTIGIADANRNDSDVISSIGFFLNLLTLRFRCQPDQSFAGAVVEARNTVYLALGNSRLPFDVLLKELNVGRSSSYSPFFQAFLDYRQGAQESHAWGNCQFDVQELHPGRTAYDITLDVTENATDAVVMFRAQKSLYAPAGAKLLMETYVHLLETYSRDISLPLKATPLFGEKQLTQAIELGRGKCHSHPLDRVVH